jgi:outer membrane protein OmpA-like peptidoglycan-associated protein
MLRRLGIALLGTWLGTLAVASQALSPPEYLVFFASGSAEISQLGDDQLRRFSSDVAKAGGGSQVFVSAHTDSAEASLPLSQARGEAVKSRLIELGVPRDSINVLPYGERMPLVLAAPGAVEPQNRRAEIVWRR